MSAATMPSSEWLSSIRTRLVLGFGLVLCLLAGLAAVAVRQVNAINSSLAVVADVNSVKQRFAINFRGSVHDRAISLRDVVLVRMPAERAAALAEIQRLAADYAASAERLDAMMATGAEVTEAEVRILASIKQTEARSLPLIARVAELQTTGDATAAQALLLEQARPAFIEWLARINQFIDLQEAKNGVVAAEARRLSSGFQTLMLALVGAGLILGIGIAAWSMRAMAPLRALAAVMRRMAAGDLAMEIPGQNRRDEVGKMAGAVMVFRAQGQEAQRLRAEQEAGREAASQAKAESLRKMADLVEAETLKAMTRIVEQAKGLAEDASAMAAATARVDHNAGAVSSAADASLAVAETVALAAEELTTSIRSISGQVREAAEVGRAAASDSTKTESVILDLSGAVSQIGDVTRLIQEIAGKTNLLALNATIEAARAGDAGKGFAVVAGEVKALATQTAKATQEISQHIQSVSHRTEAAVETVRRIAQSVARMDDLAATLATSVEQQDEATSAIARSIADSTQAARDVSRRIGQVTTDARDAGARAERSRQETDALAGEAQGLTHHVVRILRSSVPEVDRRGSPRRPAEGTATLVFGGVSSIVQLRNISEGGLAVEGSVDAAIGAHGTVQMPGQAARQVELRGLEGSRVRLAFLDAGRSAKAA
ncbi:MULTISPECIES: methyl-accepting chemotaxis protein [Roseomonadaceae]|uniref:Methyl-accepting chemotaxis protein n=1 Tax=Falsiroseomonas oleicola TaxID=2801474 RepID=A0ABS6H7U1_9PROT|nr:methyl-accepting chemotaxis protein [Roseomonas oleicola]MBU8544771.1 methyl-accepting chemotaxis protein [Roseomonas oleicola]